MSDEFADYARAQGWLKDDDTRLRHQSSWLSRRGDMGFTLTPWEDGKSLKTPEYRFTTTSIHFMEWMRDRHWELIAAYVETVATKALTWYVTMGWDGNEAKAEPWPPMMFYLQFSADNWNPYQKLWSTWLTAKDAETAIKAVNERRLVAISEGAIRDSGDPKVQAAIDSIRSFGASRSSETASP